MDLHSKADVAEVKPALIGGSSMIYLFVRGELGRRAIEMISISRTAC